MLVSGEPGIGKTSLAAAFAREAFGRRRGRAVRALRRGSRDPVSAVGRGARPARRATPPTMCSPRMSMPAATSWRGSRLISPRARRRARISSSDAESERYLLFGAVVDLLARVSALAPVVLVLDDLHWADRPTVQLLRHVVSADAPLRLFVIGTFRDSDVDPDHPLAEALAALHRESGIERHRACAASVTTSSSRCSKRRPGTRWPKRVWPCAMRCRPRRTAIRSSSVRCCGTWPRRGRSTEDEHGRWVASADLRTSGLPVSIREVIGRRVARLGDADPGCAVAGRGHRPRLRRRRARPGRRARRGHPHRPVRRGRRRRVAHRSGRGRPVHVRPRADRAHALRRSLRPAGTHPPAGRGGARGDLWRRPGRADRGARLPLGHATRPPDTAKAIAYAQQAGDRALAQLAPDEALRWYRDALDLLDRPPADDQHCRATLLLGLGDAQRQTGDPAHRETLLAAGRLADDIDAIDLLVRAALRNNRGWSSIDRWGRPTSASRCSEPRSHGSATRTAPTAPACLGAALRRAHVGRRFRRTLRWPPKPSTWRGAPATTPRWWTRSDCATSRSRCPRRSRCACDGTPRRAPSPTISATRPHDYTPTTTDGLAALEAGDLATMRTAQADLRVGMPSGSDSRSIGG